MPILGLLLSKHPAGLKWKTDSNVRQYLPCRAAAGFATWRARFFNFSRLYLGFVCGCSTRKKRAVEQAVWIDTVSEQRSF